MMFWILAFVFFLILGCEEQAVDENSIVAALKKHRIEKDVAFKTSETSPIPNEKKSDFEGLSYFPIDLTYRYQVQLNKYDQSETFDIMTSSGVKRKAAKYGYFKFKMDDNDCVLQVYKLLDVQKKYPGYLFVPFRDATTGKQTYPGGRYLDLNENPSQNYVLDFNFAYNPSCAYGKSGYNCPIPPHENTLEVSILAGEQHPALYTD